MDDIDKLETFGFAVSGCVDGFSRKVIWLKVTTTNNNSKVIANYYLKALLEHNCTSTLIRSDCGAENCLMEVLQKALRYNHTDEFAGHNSYRYGTSTANERVEKYWNQLKNQWAKVYIKFLKQWKNKTCSIEQSPFI